MKNKILKSFLVFAILLPCLILLSACGGTKNLKNKTLLFSKVEVTGSLNKDQYEEEYKNISFKFGEDTVTYIDGVIEDTYSYKVEDSKVYLKGEDQEYSNEPYAELSGNFMIVTDTYDNGVVKIYFEIK